MSHSFSGSGTALNFTLIWKAKAMTTHACAWRFRKLMKWVHEFIAFEATRKLIFLISLFTNLAEWGNHFCKADCWSLQPYALASTLATEVFLSNTLARVCCNSQYDQQKLLEERRDHSSSVESRWDVFEADDLPYDTLKAVHNFAKQRRR